MAEPFYVGYQPEPHPAIRARQRRWTLLLLALAVATATALAVGQRPSAPSRFEFGTLRPHAGWLRLEPYPVLQVPRPGAPDEATPYLLTVFGKVGAGPALAAWDGQYVTLEGQLLWRDERAMLEVEPASVAAAPAPGPEPVWASGADLSPGETVTLAGEVVDSKCYLGVMKPGYGKPHKACATLCIRGGVPPVLLVRDPAGLASYYLLLDPEGRTPGPWLLPWVAEPVHATGRAWQRGGLRFLTLERDGLAPR